MTRRDARKAPEPPEPVDAVDGIPDRSSNPAAWKYLLLAAIFLAWVAFLVYCQLAGGAGV
jgi:hypothetical protein